MNIEKNKQLPNKIIQVSDCFIYNINKYNSSKNIIEQVILSPKRLQKLVYLFEALHMKEHHGKSYLKEDFYAWPHGPAIPILYWKYISINGRQIHPIEDSILPPQKIQELINYILELTNNLDTFDLENNINCEGSPWFEVMHGKHKHIEKQYDPLYCCYIEQEREIKPHEQVIPKRKIYQYYKNKKIL